MSMITVSNFIAIQQRFTNLSDVSIKLCKSLLISGFILYIFYILSNHPCCYSSTIFTMLRPKDPKLYSDPPPVPTNLSHVVFGIAGSAKTWRNRRWYAETWWRPNITRGYIFMDGFPRGFLPWPPSSPPFLVYQDTSRYRKYDKHPIPQAIRMTHIISEIFKAENEGVRWYVLADDDTIFFVNNLADVLARYDHNKYFYIGMNSESHASNVYHSFDMAFGGAGYALSFPLAKALVNNLDVCIKRYPTLYGSDHILQSCVADLGVSLTCEKGFHQVDVHSDISGLLSAHPQSPLVSLHHLDYVNPIFPYMNQYESLNHLMEATKTDESRLLQQTICYHKPKNWSFSISWGYSVQVYEAILLPSLLQRPLQTFTPWSKSVWPLFLFNTRIPSRNPCEAPYEFFFDSVENKSRDFFVTSYSRRKPAGLKPRCSSTGDQSANNVSKIYVLSPKWKQDPVGNRRECCDVMHTTGMNSTEIKLRNCLEDEMVP